MVPIEVRWLTNRDSYKSTINRGEKAPHNNKPSVNLFSVVVFTLAWSSRGNLGRGRETQT